MKKKNFQQRRHALITITITITCVLLKIHPLLIVSILDCSIKSKLELFVKNYSRVIYENFHCEFNFTKNDQNLNFQLFMHCEEHFLFCTEIIYKVY